MIKAPGDRGLYHWHIGLGCGVRKPPSPSSSSGSGVHANELRWRLAATATAGTPHPASRRFGGCGRRRSQRRHWSSRRRLRALPPLDGWGFRRWRWRRRLEFGQDRVRFELGGRHVDECAFLHRYGSDRDGQRQISVEHIGHRKSLVGGDRQRAWRAAEAAARGARFCAWRVGLIVTVAVACGSSRSMLGYSNSACSNSPSSTRAQGRISRR